MNKINKMLTALAAFTILSITGANSLELRTGLSANGMAGYANVEEKLKDSNRISNQEAIVATSFASVFAEVSVDEAMGLGIGVMYAPEVLATDTETRAIQPSGTGDSGDQIAKAEFEDLMQLYLTLPIGDGGAYVKGGYMQMTMTTNETLATGSSYPDEEIDGTFVGAGYQSDIGDAGVFWRAEGQYQMLDDISLTGSEEGGTSGSKNVISAELGSVMASFSIGMKF